MKINPVPFPRGVDVYQNALWQKIILFAVIPYPYPYHSLWPTLLLVMSIKSEMKCYVS